MRILGVVVSLLVSSTLASYSQTTSKSTGGAKPVAGAQAPASASKPAAAKPPAQSSAAVQKCDTLAGHPGDRGHKGDGVADEDLVPLDAIASCTTAVQQQPKNGRLVFQLGRAYWIGHQYEKAVKYLLDAEELKYAPAYHYLGLAYEQGRVKGEKPDKEFAKELYQMAAAEGFDADGGGADTAAPARIVEKAEDLDASQFKEPQIVRMLFSGDFDKLNTRRSSVLQYARGMQEFVTLDPNEYDETCLKIADRSLSSVLDPPPKDMNAALGDAMTMLRRAMSAPRVFAADVERNQETFQHGVDDMNVLSEDYGACAGPVVQRVYANLRRFVREKPSAPAPTAAAPATASAQPRGFEPLSGSRDRLPQPTDAMGASDRTELMRIRQELADLASQGFSLTECVYGRGPAGSVLTLWKTVVPRVSDELRAGMRAVLPLALAHCPKQENIATAMRNVVQARMAPVNIVQTAIAFSDLAPPTFPALTPNQEMFRQGVMSMQGSLLSCQFPGDAGPVLYWKGSLPQSGGQIDWDFLQFVNTYWKVLPVAVDACPASIRLAAAESTFKNY